MTQTHKKPNRRYSRPIAAGSTELTNIARLLHARFDKIPVAVFHVKDEKDRDT